MSYTLKTSDINRIKSVSKTTAEKIMCSPRKVFLFSGHMIDQIGRENKRFPSEKVDIAKEKIIQTLEKFDAGEDDLAFTQGACGGDILFTEACLDKGVKVIWLQPFDESDFIEKSVNICGNQWNERYQNVKRNLFYLPQSSIQTFRGVNEITNLNKYELCNLWLFHTALSFGEENVYFITLWDGEKGDGHGGTADMYRIMNRQKDQVEWIKSYEL